MVVMTSSRRWPRAARCWSTSLGDAPLRMHVRAYDARKMAASPNGMSTIIANVRRRWAQRRRRARCLSNASSCAYESCCTGIGLWRRFTPGHSCRYSSGHDVLHGRLVGNPLHLHLHESLLLTQHALSLLLRSLKKQIHAGLQNRSIRRLRPASRTAMTATTQSPAIATKFLLLKSCRKAQQLPTSTFSELFSPTIFWPSTLTPTDQNLTNSLTKTVETGTPQKRAAPKRGGTQPFLSAFLYRARDDPTPERKAGKYLCLARLCEAVSERERYFPALRSAAASAKR